MPRLAVLLLGPPRLVLDNSHIELSRRKGLALIAYLAAAGEPVSRELLAELLWPEFESSRSLAALRRTLSIVRRELPQNSLSIGRYSLQLTPSDQVKVDVRRFRESLNRGLQDRPSSSALASLQEAEALYRGEFLAGFALSDCREFEDWRSLQSESLQRGMREALERLVVWQAALGQLNKASASAARWLELDPLSESAHRAVMKVRAWAGQRSEAICHFHRCRKLLRDELGIRPEAETVALLEVLLEDRIPPPPRFTELQDGGDGDSPKPTSSVQLDTRTSQPRRADPMDELARLDRNALFVGRTRELETIEQRLLTHSCRLLTLLGPGGIGKTRLAVRAAVQFSDRFPDGVLFVPLASTRSSQALLPMIAERIGLSGEGHADPLRQLVQYLRPRKMLLVLDNFEQLLDSVPVLEEIVARCPDTRLLVTSRARLQLGAEWLIELEGLSLPGLGKLKSAGDSEAVRLFIEYARRVCSLFDPSADEMADLIAICRQVSGMPLAIELIAPWIRVLSLREIRQEIGKSLELIRSRTVDRPERHQSLKRVFEASCSLLTPEETEVLLKLSVFQGGVTRPAAQRVAQANAPILIQLIDKSFLQRRSGGGYQMHPLLQRWAFDKLKSLPGQADRIGRRHARYYSALLHRHTPDLRGGSLPSTLQAVGREFDNIKAAWDWAVEQADKGLIEQSLEGLYRFCLIRSRFAEGRQMLEQALSSKVRWKDSGSGLAALRARLEVRKARFQACMGDLDGSQAALRKCLRSLGRHEAPQEHALARSQLGLLDVYFGNYPAARLNLEKSLEIYREIEDRPGLGQCMMWLGRACSEAGDFTEAAELLNKGCEIFEELGDLRGVASCCTNLGNIYMLSEKPQLALSFFTRSQSLYSSVGNRFGCGVSFANLGTLSLRLGEYQKARRFFLQAEEVFNDVGLQSSIYQLRLSLNLCETYLALGELETFVEASRRVLSRAVELRAKPALLDGMSIIARFLARHRPSSFAFELAAFVAGQSGAEKEVRDRAERIEADLCNSLPPVQAARLRRSAPGKSLQAMLERAVRELDGESGFCSSQAEPHFPPGLPVAGG